ncbi:MAG TPA: ATP-binding cassette domain-containing protein [Thermoanaerobaculia bacterium]|nr:ATP-binding cassette domain-containing protein [Thermoanaerobaculia bacterium]
MTILETQGLTRRFGDFTAVDGLTIAVPEGEAFGLLGPNGAGKTTAIRMLTTLLTPTAGSARVAGFDLAREPAAVRRAIGYVPQAVSVDGSLTAYENLLIFAKLYDIPRKEREGRIGQALDLVGLTEHAGRLVREFSGGMIRRLEIAESTLHRPPLLFLDEPTVGLDPLARAAVWEHIQKLHEAGTSIFLTTHYMEEADDLCDRLAILHRGKVAAIGSPAELKASLGREAATLDDVFLHYAGDALDAGGDGGGSFRETSRGRRHARRLG